LACISGTGSCKSFDLYADALFSSASWNFFPPLISSSIASLSFELYSVCTLSAIVVNIHLCPFSPNAVFAHINSTQLPCFHGIGTIGIDHIALSAKFLKDLINHSSHNFEDSTAAQTKNRVAAIQKMEITKRHITAETHAISKLTNHHSILSHQYD
jgi:hypothetical protein